MTPMRELPCCGCGAWLTVMPFVTVRTKLDLTGAVCRHCYRLAPAPVRAALRSARLDMRFDDGIDQTVLLFRAWEAVRLSIAERRARRAA